METKKRKKPVPPHNWTEEQADFLRRNIKGTPRDKIVEMVNEEFGINLTPGQVKRKLDNMGLRNGIDGRFKPGVATYRGGKGWPPTQFKKGCIPPNAAPVGAERVTVDGYVEVKTAPGMRKWVMKHRLIWEKLNGPVPEGHVIIFADQNRKNFDKDNLILVSRRQLSIMNHNKLIKKDPELTKAGVAVASIYNKIKDMEARE